MPSGFHPDVNCLPPLQSHEDTLLEQPIEEVEVCVHAQREPGSDPKQMGDYPAHKNVFLVEIYSTQDSSQLQLSGGFLF